MLEIEIKRSKLFFGNQKIGPAIGMTPPCQVITKLFFQSYLMYNLMVIQLVEQESCFEGSLVPRPTTRYFSLQVGGLGTRLL